MRGAQLALLAVFLVLWEVLPKAQIINPLFTSYPSTIWPTFLDMLNATPQQASILTHTWATTLATVVGFPAAMVLGTAIAAALWWWNALYKVLVLTIEMRHQPFVLWIKDLSAPDPLSPKPTRKL